MASSEFMLWFTENRSTFFLLPNGYTFGPGLSIIKTLEGRSAVVNLESLSAYEVTEDQARHWAKEQLGQALDEIRGAMDGKLTDWRRHLDEFNRTPVTEGTTVTPNAASTLFDLLKQLPGVLVKSLSGDESRVGEARDTMADLRRRLTDSGIDLDERFTNFPDRLADLRREVEQEQAAKKSTKDEPPPDKR